MVLHALIASRLVELKLHCTIAEALVRLDQARDHHELMVHFMSAHVPSGIGTDSVDRISMVLQGLQHS